MYQFMCHFLWRTYKYAASSTVLAPSLLELCLWQRSQSKTLNEHLFAPSVPCYFYRNDNSSEPKIDPYFQQMIMQIATVSTESASW